MSDNTPDRERINKAWEDAKKKASEESKRKNSITPVISRGELPPEQASKLLPEEMVYHFGYIDAVGGGCANASTAKQWILITNQRILFEAAVKDNSNPKIAFVHQSGSIPMPKVSYVGTSNIVTTEGCSQKTTSSLRINSSGGEITLAIPTKAEAQRIHGVIDAIISQN